MCQVLLLDGKEYIMTEEGLMLLGKDEWQR